ncbi:MAG TPA: DNA-binding response regulator [Cyanothece sp. UBA12306]|nr:DNA-binding response regulator [Cyanothece sp. UBA12306]
MTETILQSYPENIKEAIRETLNWQGTINKKELTDREQEVLYFISLGWNEVETSQALNITPHTYRSYTRNILNKLNANNKAEAIAKAFRCGLLST